MRFNLTTGCNTLLQLQVPLKHRFKFSIELIDTPGAALERETMWQSAC